MIKRALTLAILSFASASVAAGDSEALSYAPARGIRIDVLCTKEAKGMAVQINLQRNGLQGKAVIVSLPEAHPCSDVVSVDEDFDGDGVNDIAINDLSMTPISSRQIFLVSMSQGAVIAAGRLPIDASKEKSGNYVSVQTSGGSIVRDEYSIRYHKFVLISSFEKVVAGDVCTSPVKTIVSDDACKGRLISASFERPVCIKHMSHNSAAIVPKDRCNFSL
ncbi:MULTISPECIES: hypothetical protein [unclassified Dyella]|uniref:hypothetical protein n=1 Tax=unclassified Dyella TaxID=2634549 RepID=UPI000C82DC0C|nr:MULTISPECIES: hypothetical protein [unclassified Dyella]MDR3448023.1 hypothetical protein [Dyella sp.]PMQ05476.1 hypothetical protein DyAD56_09105 [Dyella sp. AD56]